MHTLPWLPVLTGDPPHARTGLGTALEAVWNSPAEEGKGEAPGAPHLPRFLFWPLTMIPAA